MLTFGYPWLFFVLPLPLLVRWLLPAYGEQRPAVRMPFFKMLTETSGAKVAEDAVLRRRSVLQALLLIVIWCAAASRETLMAFSTARALLRPWPITTTPFTPNSGAPPHSE